MLEPPPIHSACTYRTDTAVMLSDDHAYFGAAILQVLHLKLGSCTDIYELDTVSESFQGEDATGRNGQVAVKAPHKTALSTPYLAVCTLRPMCACKCTTRQVPATNSQPGSSEECMLLCDVSAMAALSA